MYKSAGIESKKEAAQRLINGEKFYWEGLELRFDPSFAHPFRAGECDLIGAWYYYKLWDVKSEWYDNLGEGVLCWTWDNGEEKGSRPAIVVLYDNARDSCRFRVKEGWWVRHAEPMTKEERERYAAKGD